MPLGMAVFAGPASASFVYTYTSNVFETASAPLTTSDQITFVFETASALAAGAETRLNATPDFFNATPNILSWNFTVGGTMFGSASVGEVFDPLFVLLSNTGSLARICGGGRLVGVGSFTLNNAPTPGGLISGTSCSNAFDNFDSVALTGGASGFVRGLGTWNVREVQPPPPPPPPPPPADNGVPEPASLMLAAAALLALGATRRSAPKRA